MRIVDREVALKKNQDVEAEILLKVQKVYGVYAGKGIGILVGPNEWFALVKSFKERTGFKDRAPKEGSYYIMGLPVYVKTGSGIEVMIPADQAWRFALGEVKPKGDSQ